MPRRFLLVSVLLALALVPCLPASQVMAGGLSDDGRAAVVLAVQGTALVQPGGRLRWTPLSQRSVLFPGDVIRTDARGAHALEVQLAGGGKLLVGPGTVLELRPKGGVRLMRGELEAKGAAKRGVDLQGPGNFTADVKGTAWLRTKGRQTQVLKTEPKWITGYRSSAGDEWMGSLLAQVDGRDVPLAVGYYKVRVEIRDQIARTTVEQAFVNTTAADLEGVFYFPLPADASISGFGMWIGGELVEADIVEKERARQIYEDILRRKKDPGLLEWEGGNLFKARVFPIPRNGEKRIRIRYTQVLPMEGSTYRYRHALRSELLSTKPLRKLDLEVRVVSDQLLGEVASPTHEIRLQQTRNTAVASFTAQEFSPDRDFELAVTVSSTAPITMLPHRRGDDGYLMLQLAAPDEAAGGWQRDLMPETGPLDLVLVADTSGSMDAAARRSQADFLRSLLGLLSEKDTFRLLAFDHQPVWIEAERLPVRQATIDQALAALHTRTSLGWSDLDLGLATAFKQADSSSTVVYVGDGIGTTGDADPVALAARLRGLGATTQCTVHAVSPGSKYETGVLEALASIGGGSVREVGSAPVRTAYALLSEIARPAIKDLRVTIEGLRTARVYPSALPNLPAGRQQIVLGRFLPSKQSQTGRVIMTGTLAGKPVRFHTEVTIPPADVGNSFLPRLWARKHLDALLLQGRTPANRTEIVQFSERFGIMTPYTSFLVVESDEDREKYGLTRRVKMRDGERFFADAADKAQLEARRAAMKQAGTWRLGIRRTMLREIASLARDLPVPYFQPVHSVRYAGWGDGNESIGIGGGGAFGGRAGSGPTTGGVTADAAGSKKGFHLEDARKQAASNGADRGAPMPEGSPAPASAMAPRESAPMDGVADKSNVEDFEESLEKESDNDVSVAKRPMSAPRARGRSSRFMTESRRSGARGFAGNYGYLPSHRYIGNLRDYLAYRVHNVPVPLSVGVLGWPGVAPAPKPDADTAHEEPEWDARIKTLLRATWRRPSFMTDAGAYHLTYDATTLHPLRGTLLSARQRELWVRSDAWYDQSRGLGNQPHESWTYADQRGVLAAGLRLARTRKAARTDGADWGFPFRSLGRYDPVRAWVKSEARIVSEVGDIITIGVKYPGVHDNETHLVIDTKRGLLLEQVTLTGTRVTGRSVWSKHVDVGGTWWPTSFAQLNAEGKAVRRAAMQIEAITPATLDEVVKAKLAAQADVITIHGPLPTVEEAKQARHDREATFVDEVVLALHFARTQQWDPTWTHWKAARAMVSDKPGEGYARAALMQRSRQGEAFKVFLATLADQVATVKDPHQAAFLAPYLHGLASGVLGWTEQGALWDRFKNAWIQPAAPDTALRQKVWMSRKIQSLQGSNQLEAARALRRVYADTYPFDVAAQLGRENDLWSTGRRALALDFLAQVLSGREPWTAAEREQLYVSWTNRLWEARSLDRLEAALAVWMSTEPTTRTAYQRFASLLYLRGRVEQADKWVTLALAKRLNLESSQSAWQRQEAAVQIALGQAWNFRINRVEKMWWQPLQELVLAYARADLKRGTPANQVMSHWRFRQTQAYKDVRTELRVDLDAGTGLAGFSLQRLALYLRWLPWNRGAVDPAFWRKTTDALLKRYAAAELKPERDVLAGHVLSLLDAHGEKTEALTFLRGRLAAASKLNKHTFAATIWTRLMQGTYTAAAVDELFNLLPLLPATSTNEEQRRSLYATHVRQLAGRIDSWRREAAMGPAAGRKDLTRAALKALQQQARTAGRAAVVSRFKAAALDAPAAARPWLQSERLGYAVQIGQDLEAITAEARGVLLREWAAAGNPLDRILRERAAVVLAYTATRRTATDAQIESALTLFAAGAKAQAAYLAENEDAVALLDWNYQTFRLLVALDRGDAVEAVLATWIVPSKIESRWRMALAYIHAERGRVAEATRQFEAIESADELGPTEYRTLADWYLVLDQDAAHRRALDGVYEKSGEYQLANLLAQHTRQTSRANGVPGDLDPEALRLMRILMRKSSYPANHIWRIRNLYRSLKDFRLLESMVDGLTGHTKEGIYNFLIRFRQITEQIHEEATCDAMVARMELLMRGKVSDLDRRALRLLMALVEQRAADVPETDPTHEQRAMAALKAAQVGAWQPGERRLMANFLSGVKFPAQGAFAKEQLRQLRVLLDDTPKDSAARVWIGQAFAHALWTYQRHDLAIDILVESIQQERARTGGVLTANADGVFNTLIARLDERKRFRDAETRLLAEMRRRTLPARIQILEDRLFQVYTHAVYHNGSTGLGSGRAQFEAVGKRILARIEADVVRANGLLSTYAYLHVAAKHGGAVTDAGQRLLAYARKQAPLIYARLPLRAHRLMAGVATNVRKLLGPNAGISVMLDHADRESGFVHRIGYNVWRQHHYSLARWRYESHQPLGALSGRLWALVERAVEQKLVTGDNTGGNFWNPHSKWYWGARRGDYGVVAGRIFELNETSSVIVARVAQFQRSLGFNREAVASIRRALVHDADNINLRWTLVGWLHADRLDKEALPLITGLVKAHPSRIAYWRMQVDVEGRLKDRQAMARTLKLAEAWFRDNERWREGIAAALGQEAVEHRFPEEGVRLYQEAIELRIAARGYRGGRDTGLANYYRILAAGLGQLQRTDEAIRAVSAAFVAGSRNAGQRTQTTRTLDGILRHAKDLAAFGAAHEAEVEKTGLDATLIRKALAKAFNRAGQHEVARGHLLAAREVDPNDNAIHQALVATYDKLGDAAGAVEALFGSIRLAPQNVKAYEDLAQRYLRQKLSAEAERALTTLVEVTPNDVAGHKRLAEIRQEHGHLEAAAVQWAQVIRTRRLEPTGYFGHARVLIKLGRAAAARKDIDHLLQAKWESRFGDVKAEAARLLRGLDG